MRITVFGASGGIGTEVVRQALAAGEEVTAVIRDTATLEVEGSDRLRVVRAQVTDPEAIRPAFDSTDAVVSALGPRRGEGARICSTGTASILQAMSRTGKRRLVVVSAGGAFIDEGDGFFMRHVLKPWIVQRLLRESFADLRVMEAAVRASGLDWTIVRPPALSDRLRTGRYRTEVDRNVRGGLKISRADVADLIRGALVDPTTIRHTLAIAY